MKNYIFLALIFFTYSCYSSLANEELIEAIDAGDAQHVADALLKGADANTKTLTLKVPVLHKAVYAGRIDLVTLLLSYGANKDIQSSSGATALDRAAFLGNNEIIKLLLKSSSGYSQVSPSAFYTACKMNHADTVLLLLQLGANPMIKNKENQNAFEYCKEQASPQALEMLVQYCRSNNTAARAALMRVFKEGSIGNLPKEIREYIVNLAFPELSYT